MNAEAETNPDQIRASLKSLRALRFASHFPWLVIVLMGLAYAVLPPGGQQAILPAYQLFFAWAAAGLFMSNLIRRYPCPRCGERFHYRRRGERFLSLYPYNDFATKCTHCGLRLDGRNA